MRSFALLAAVTMIHTVHALPRHDLAVRQGVNDLSNERHIFHHLDRNQRTANRDRERVGGYDTGLSGANTVVGRPGNEGGMDRRFMRGPDYSGDPGAVSDTSGQSSSSSTPTQQAEKPDGTANGHT